MDHTVSVSAPLGSSRLADAAVKIILTHCRGIAIIVIGPPVELDHSVEVVSCECRRGEHTVVVTLPVKNGFRRLIVELHDPSRREEVRAEMLTRLQSARLPVETIDRTFGGSRAMSHKYKPDPKTPVTPPVTPPLPMTDIESTDPAP